MHICVHGEKLNYPNGLARMTLSPKLSRQKRESCLDTFAENVSQLGQAAPSQARRITLGTGTGTGGEAGPLSLSLSI